MAKSEAEGSAKEMTKPICFMIMPVTDPDGYVKGHFRHVYDDILAPACDKAGFSAVREDLVKQSNLIHLDILQKLLNAPMAVCDLSSRNPNVMFELALRQAFDKPVALVQEVGTPPVFDISPFRYSEYRKERVYHEVLEDQSAIAAAVRDTFDAHKTGKGVNSIVKLLALSTPATIPEINAPEASANIQQLILSELSQFRDELRSIRRDSQIAARRGLSRESLPDLERIKELTMRTEILLSESDAMGLDRAEMALAECKDRLMRFSPMPLRPDDSSTMRERDIYMELRHRIDMLEHELQKKRIVVSEKKK